MKLIRPCAGMGAVIAISLAAATALTNSASAAPVSDAGSADTKKPATQRQTEPGRCYRIVVERHPTLCKQWVRNLNFFCDEPPMICGFKVHPSMKHLFSEPPWVPLDPVADFKWVRMVYLARVLAQLPNEPAEQSRQAAEKRVDEEYPDLLHKAQSGRLKLSWARFNPINVSGYGLPIVYRVDDLDCALDAPENGQGRPASPRFAAVDEGTGDIDRRYDVTTWHGTLIRFRGAFTYQLGESGPGPGDHYLFTPTQTRELCEIRHQQGGSK